MDIMKNEKFTNECRNVINALAVQCIAAFEVLEPSVALWKGFEDSAAFLYYLVSKQWQR